MLRSDIALSLMLKFDKDVFYNLFFLTHSWIAESEEVILHYQSLSFSNGKFMFMFVNISTH
jgi:hypothetical protein